MQAGSAFAERVDLLDGGRTASGVAGDDPHVGADAGEFFRRHEPESGVPARDHDGLPGHVEEARSCQSYRRRRAW